MKAIVFAIMAGVCWGVGELCTKCVLHTKQVGPITAIAVRSSVALPVLWLAYLVSVHGLRLEPSTWLKSGRATLAPLILGSGLVAGAAAMIFFYAALNLGEISRIKPIAFTIAPATAVILGWLVLGEALTLRKTLAVGLVLLGVVLLTTGPAPARAGSPPVAAVGGPPPSGAASGAAEGVRR